MSEVRTLPQAIEDAAKAEPTRGFRFIPESGVPNFSKAESTSEASFSFTAIERASARYGGALQALGLKKGDRIGLILPTHEDFILCFCGAIRAGILPVPIYPPAGLGKLQGYLDNTRHIIAKSGARAIVTTSKIKRLLGTVQEACPEVEQIVAIEAIRESLESLKPEKITPDDYAFLQFTSGSTSRPKGVCLTHANLTANITNIAEHGLRVRSDDVGISWLPLYHDMGLIGFVLAPLFYQIPIVYLPPLTFLKRPVTWFQAFTRHKGTIAYAPNFAFALCTKRIRPVELEGIDLRSWRVAGCGAEPIRPETLETFVEAFAGVGFHKETLFPSYGMAESTLAVTFVPPGEGMSTISVDGPVLWSKGVAQALPESDPQSIRLVSCGQALPGHTVTIFDPEDTGSTHPLPERTVGEVRLTGPSLMKGYWEDAEKTAESMAGSYFRTGDLGLLDKGRLFLCGRSKDIVIVNGRNYYPQDMEWEASKVDGIRRGNVIAFGAGDPNGAQHDREKVVIAFEVQKPTDLARASDLVAAVRKAVQDGLALTLDDAIALAPGSLPKTSSGKLQRSRTRELYEQGRLSELTPAGAASKIDLIKAAAVSQLSYFKLAVLGGRKRT